MSRQRRRIRTGSRDERRPLPRRGRRVLVVLLIAGLIAVAAVGAHRLTRTEPVEVSAMFTETVGLYPGSDVRVLGLPVGTVTAIEPQGPLVRVDMQLDPDQRVSADTGAAIVAPSLVSDRYVQLTQPWTSGRTLSSGAVIDAEKTETPVEIDQLYGSLKDITDALGPQGANSDQSLSKLISVGADNLDGNGSDIAVLLRELSKATGTLSGSDEDLFATVTNLDDFNQTLVANDRGVAQVNAQLADVTGYLADDRADLATAIDSLGEALGVVDDFIRDNRGNLTTSVQGLVGPTRTLVRQRSSLEETVRTLPVALQNLVRAYDPASGTLIGRADLNELTVWAGSGAGTAQAPAGSAAGSPPAARRATDLPPVLLPGLGQQ